MVRRNPDCATASTKLDVVPHSGRGVVSLSKTIHPHWLNPGRRPKKC